MNKDSQITSEKKPATKKSRPITNKDTIAKHASRYLIVGIAITVFNYGTYTILANLIINNNDLLWLSSLISTFITTIVAYLLHSKITWKERTVTKKNIYNFFIWNMVAAFIIGPLLTQFFSLFTPLYEFAYQIVELLHLPFSYEFTLTTGVFVLTSIVSMILNFFFYDRFVFGKSKQT